MTSSRSRIAREWCLRRFWSGYAYKRHALVIAGIVLVRNPRIPRSDRSRKGDLLAGTSGRTDDGHFPVTIEGQLVMSPQVKGWAYIVSVAALVSLLYWIISALFNKDRKSVV